MFQVSERPTLVGVVHLAPLPGAPRASMPLDQVVEQGVRDAVALVEGGVQGLIVENLGDAPFCAEQVPPYTVAAMTRVVSAVRAAVGPVSLGVNILRNDALAALSVAAAVGAEWIRVNVHVGAMVTDQGLITGRARETLLARAQLGAKVSIAADVMVKHAVPLGSQDLAQSARDTWHRGGADALIVTGTGTGRPIEMRDLMEVREAVPGAPIVAGSGVDPNTLEALRPWVDSVIVGTYFHRDNQLSAPVDVERVRAIRAML